MNNKLLPLALLTACCVSGSVLAQVANTVPSYYGTVIAKKFYDKNANGHRDPGEPFLSGWPMTLTGPSFGPNTKALHGYLVGPRERPATGCRKALRCRRNWVQSAPTDINGNPINPVSVTVDAIQDQGREVRQLLQETQRRQDPGLLAQQERRSPDERWRHLAPELGLLSSLNLVDARRQGDFDPTTHAEFATWLLDGNAVNMAYMLSVHLAAMTAQCGSGPRQRGRLLHSVRRHHRSS